MDQYEINDLYNQFDQALGIGKAADDPKRLRANMFQLSKLEKTICTFEHLQYPDIKIQYDYKTRRIL